MAITDQELTAHTIRTIFSLIKTVNARLWTNGLVFRRELLLRGIGVLENKKELTPMERNNLQRFNDKWSMEVTR